MSNIDQYDFEEIIYLKKFLFLPSSSLYKTFKQLYKPSYAPNERIVVAFQGTLPYDLIAHLQRVVQHLDITNCFVLLCTTDPDAESLVNAVHSKYSTDPTKFEIVNIDIPDQQIIQENHRPLLNPPETMCMYPWKQIEFKPSGAVRPCCVYSGPLTNEHGQEFNMNNKGSFSIESIYFSPTMKTLRQEFRDGHRPAGCSKCWREEDSGKKSDRMLYNWALKDELYNIDYESEDIKNITSVDLKLGNLCNLSCRTCSPTLSSSWAVENLSNIPPSEKKTHPAYISLRNGNWPNTQPVFWTELERLLPNLNYCQFAGGEPLMLPRQFDVLKKAIDLDCAKNITLRYNTNGTQCPESIFELWEKFKLVHLDISIDDIGDRFEYQRNGANWNQVVKNIHRFNQERRFNFKTQVSTVVSIMNVLYLPELCEWYNSQDFDSWWINLVWTPQNYCITNMTESAKDLVLQKLTNYNFGQHQSQIDVVVAMVEKGQPVTKSKFVQTVAEIDQRRNQDLRFAHKEIANAMGYMLN